MRSVSMHSSASASAAPASSAARSGGSSPGQTLTSLAAARRWSASPTMRLVTNTRAIGETLGSAPMSMRTRRLAALVSCSAVAVTAPIALGATKHGITPLAPKAGSTVKAGTRPTFKMRVKGPGTVWVHVCKSPKKNGKGVICHSEMIDQAHKKGSIFQLKVKFFQYPAFWLNRPGTYYWQAHRIDCSNGKSDCLQEG